MSANDSIRQLRIEGGDAWTAVSASFAALGRVVLLLDGSYRILRASDQLDRLTCSGTAARIVGHPVSDLLGSRMFVLGGGVHRELSRGKRVEGRRAFIKCSASGARLVSVSVAPLPASTADRLQPETRFMVVVRPDDLDSASDASSNHHGLMARSPAMLHIVGLIEALNESEATVLLTGETGTGKGVVAAAIHAHSPRQGKPFITVDAGAIPGELLESELFGHVRGAFTGAHRDRVGQVELAQGGTLFIDEIGDLPLALQSKLLRLVQEREFRRLGDSAPRPTNARIIAATNVDLAAAVAQGRFREDLFYRLRVVPIHVPPLRQRVTEIAPLAGHLLNRLAHTAGRSLSLGPDAIATLEAYHWPGNVRQLENALAYAVTLCRGHTIHSEHLPAELSSSGAIFGAPRALAPPQLPTTQLPPPQLPPPQMPNALPSAPPAPPAAKMPLATPTTEESSEAAALRATLDRHRWNRNAAAAALGISRTTLWRRMRRLGLG